MFQVLNPFDNEAINYTFIGITDLEDLTETDPEVTSANAKIDHKIYLSFRFASLEDEDVFRARTFGNFMGKGTLWLVISDYWGAGFSGS